MLVCWGVSAVIDLIGIAFPASVAAMVLLFLMLLAIELAMGERRVKRWLWMLEIPVRWIM